MKSRILFSVLLSFFVQSLTAQVIDTRETHKKRAVDYRTGAFFYPFAAISDNFRVALEQRPTNTLGLRGVLTFGFGEDNFFYDAKDFSSFGGEVQVRYYPIRNNPSVYTAAFASGKGITITREDDYLFDPLTNTYYYVSNKYNAAAFSFGVIGGLQFQVAKMFLIDAYIGAGPNIPTGDYKTGATFNNTIWGYRKGMRYNGGLNFGVILFK